MPTATANGIDLNYVESGHGAQTVVFAHGLLLDHHRLDLVGTCQDTRSCARRAELRS